MALLWVAKDFAKAATKTGVQSVPRDGLAQLPALSREDVEKVAVHCATAAGPLSVREIREALKTFEGWIQTGDDRFVRSWRLVEGRGLIEKVAAELGGVPIVPSDAAVEHFLRSKGLAQNALVCEAAEADGMLYLAYWAFAEGALVLTRTVPFTSSAEAAEDLWRTVRYCARYSRDWNPLPLVVDQHAFELARRKDLEVREAVSGSVVLEGLSLLPVRQIAFVTPLDAKPARRPDGAPVRADQRGGVLARFEDSVLQELLGVKTQYRSSLKGVVRAAAVIGFALLIGSGGLLFTAKSELERTARQRAALSAELSLAQQEAHRFASRRLISLLGLREHRTRELVRAMGKVPPQVRLTKVQMQGGRIELRGEVVGSDVPDWGRVTTEGEKMIWLAEF